MERSEGERILQEEGTVVVDEDTAHGEVLEEGHSEDVLIEGGEEDALEEDQEQGDVLATTRFEILGTVNNDGSNVYVSENVVNLSERILTSSEIKVLSRGLNFCPTPKDIDKGALIKDLSEFGRRMKCKAHFAAQNSEIAQNVSDELARFKSKSTWTPTLVDPALDLFLKNVEEKVMAIEASGCNYSNMGKEECKALKDLKSYRDIVIKEADKGSAVVVWGIENYCKEAYRQLGDAEIYELVENDPIEEVSRLIEAKLSYLTSNKIISEENLKYLKGRDLKLGRFYLLPKIHKRLVDVPGRPVISNCGTPTEGISEFVDFYLQPIIKTLPYIVKDTTDFLCKLRGLGDIPDGAIICTMDVVGLYPHIPHDEGLRNMEDIIKEFEEANVCRITANDLVELAKLILENNFFEFDGKLYRQKLGTAIGTKFAPSFANMFMSKLERKMLLEYHLNPWIWLRFLDDIFLIWVHGKESLLEFLNYVNSYYDTIKYTWEWSYESISYLDVMIKINDNKISTDVYSKPTDTHQYLDNSSCHPRHVKQGIPYGQALRIRRICDSDEVCEARLKELCGHFIKRGFKSKAVDIQISKVRNISRESLLCQDSRNRKSTIKERMPLVIDFHPALSGLSKVIDSAWPVLHASENMRKIFVEKPMVAFRRPRNLKDAMVRSKVKRENNVDTGMRKCGKSRCQICKFVKEGRTFDGENRSFVINFTFNCDSKGVIYLIVCKKCGKLYVGSTITSFRKRFNNHKSSATRYGRGIRGIPGEHLYAHFFGEGHEGVNDISVIIIDKTDVREPTRREAFWAYKLNSFVPRGLNLRDFT